MGIAFTGLAYDGDIEKGGHGLKLGFYRCQGIRLAKKTVRKCRVLPDGKKKYDGEVVREIGDPYEVDCNVTGSDEGTSNDPKFSLKKLFEDEIFPKVIDLVKEGGAYDGYLPVFQGDNAGPHTDGKLQHFVTSFCEEKKWMWEPQAPQMPHANNLDLAVFPAMSKRHSALLSLHGSRSMAQSEEIWKNAETVWINLPSSTIARGFLHGHRILKKVVEEHKGDNKFLQTKDFHTGVSRDFEDTAFGIQRIQN
jgi:hypothetical protein